MKHLLILLIAVILTLTKPAEASPFATAARVPATQAAVVAELHAPALKVNLPVFPTHINVFLLQGQMRPVVQLAMLGPVMWWVLSKAFEWLLSSRTAREALCKTFTGIGNAVAKMDGVKLKARSTAAQLIKELSQVFGCALPSLAAAQGRK